MIPGDADHLIADAKHDLDAAQRNLDCKPQEAVKDLLQARRRIGQLLREIEVPVIVRAEVWSDDHVHNIQFDAVEWLQQASDEEILALAEMNWSGGYEADAVARFFEDSHEEIERLMVNCQEHGTGFECRVDAEAALKWLQDNRPQLYGQVKKSQE